jgi:hypothetical protein
MLLRVWRISTAASAAPRTTAGIRRRWVLPQRSSNGETNPEAGSHWSRTERSRISMIPSQKFGIDTPQRDTPLAR